MQPNSCIHIANHDEIGFANEKVARSPMPTPRRFTGNRATVRCKKTCCENAFGIACARGVQPTILFPDSLDGSRGVLRCVQDSVRGA